MFFSIGELTDLEMLDLSFNPDLTTLPDSIGNIKSLRELGLANCRFMKLPER